MPFSISGRIAAGADEALEQVLDRRLKEAIRQQQERDQVAARQLQQQGIDLQRETLEAGKADRAADNALNLKRFGLEDLRYREGQAKEASEKATGEARASDIANVLKMPGMTQEEQLREAAGPMLRSGADPLKVIAGLVPAKKPLHYVAVPGPDGRPVMKGFTEEQMAQGVRQYEKPEKPTKAEKVEPLWVSIGGKPVDLHGVAPPGSAPITASTNYQTEVRDETNRKAVNAMKTYGDDMIDVIGSLLDEKGELKPDAKGVIGGWQGLWPEGTYLGEKSQDALTAISRLQKMLDINQLRELKAQSRTGATGFGALSAPELAIIEGAASKLGNRRQSEAVYKEELQRILGVLLKNREGASESSGGGGGGGGAPKTETAAEKIRRLSGGG
jgi:hypothetical protein